MQLSCKQEVRNEMTQQQEAGHVSTAMYYRTILELAKYREWKDSTAVEQVQLLLLHVPGAGAHEDYIQL